MVEKNTKGRRPASPEPRSTQNAPLLRLERLIAVASASLLWEKFWRAAMPPMLIVGLFIAVSFAGLWLNVSATWRMLGVAFFGCALAMSLLPFFGLRRPPRQQALVRIDRSSSLAHNPASSLHDQLANDSSDPTTRALWALHRRRMMQAVANLRVGVPSPRMVDFDRYAIRAAILILLVASAFIAGPEKYARLAAAFDWRGSGTASLGYRIDAWIDPPAYTGKPPVLLNISAAKDWDQAERISAPINSTVIVRASGGDVGVEAQGPLDPAKDKAKIPSVPPTQGDTEQRLVLHGDAQLGLRHAGELVGLFAITAIPDKPPEIALTDAPRANVRGSLTLSYKISDDYGVTSAQADFANPSIENAPGKMRSLVAPPHLSLTLPSGLGNLGETETTADVSDHPWAGARVKMTLSAHDEGGNVGRSDPIEITLPQRPFLKPIARALVEQRRNLVLFPDSHERVQTALDALMIAPEMFNTKASVFLGLSVASNMLSDAQNDADLLGVADFLWNMALQIENGDLSDAEKDLRSAEQQLRDALQRNAPDDELRKLTDNLRAAMDKFLNELAKKQAREQGQQQPQQAERSPHGNRTVSRKDLQSMLDRMQDLARSGDRNDAQQMLEQLQNTLENLQMAQQRDSDPTSREMNRALNDLDKLTRDQQRLRDETQRRAQADQQAQDQDQEQGGDHAQSGDQPDQGAQSQQGRSGQRKPMTQQQLHDLQQALRNRLEDIEKRLKEVGQNQQGLTDAQKAMKDAENALQQGQQNQGQQNQGQQGQGQQGQQGEGEQGQGQQQGGQQGQGESQGGSQAVDAQGRALEALRKGTEQLAQSMQQGGAGQGNESGDEESDQEGQGQAEGAGDTDPLGRPLSNDPAFNPNSRFDPLGLPAAQRAQRVLEELRRRLGDPWRPQEELDYLERLLKPY